MNGIKGFLINLVLAAAAGYLSGGIVGSVVAALTLSIFAGLFLAWRHRDRVTVPGGNLITAGVRTAAGLVLRLVAMPLALIGSLLMTVTALVLALLAPLAGPLRLLVGLASVPGRLGRFFISLFDETVLPWTLGNTALLLVIGVLVLGIDVAFCAALIAVPLLLLALAMLAITGSEDPDAIAAEEQY